MPNIWRIAPDEGGKLWDALRLEQCIALGWDDLPDYRAFDSLTTLRASLSRRAKGDGRGGARRIWRFAREVVVGDFVVANRGESVFLGLGNVSSDYLPPMDADNPRRGAGRLTHVRRVQWIDVERTQLPKRFFGVRPNSLGALEQVRFDELLELIGKTPNGESRLKRIARMQKGTLNHVSDSNASSMNASLRLDYDVSDTLEGERFYAWRARYHRDRRLRQSVIASRRPLVCAACAFDFAATYGEELGGGYAHVHHEDAIASREGIDKPTTDERVQIVCANCHAMIHRFGECRSVDDIGHRIDAARRARNEHV